MMENCWHESHARTCSKGVRQNPLEHCRGPPGSMNVYDFRDCMLSFLFLRYLSDNCEVAARKEVGKNYPKLAPG